MVVRPLDKRLTQVRFLTGAPTRRTTMTVSHPPPQPVRRSGPERKVREVRQRLFNPPARGAVPPGPSKLDQCPERPWERILNPSTQVTVGSSPTWSSLRRFFCRYSGNQGVFHALVAERQTRYVEGVVRNRGGSNPLERTNLLRDASGEASPLSSNSMKPIGFRPQALSSRPLSRSSRGRAGWGRHSGTADAAFPHPNPPPQARERERSIANFARW
jgi:hypothetical protein